MFAASLLYGAFRRAPRLAWSLSRLRRPLPASLAALPPSACNSTAASSSPLPPGDAPAAPPPTPSPAGIPPGFTVLTTVPRTEDGIRFHRYMLSGAFALVADAATPPSSLVYKWARRRLLRAVGAGGQEVKDISAPLPAGTAIVVHHSLQQELRWVGCVGAGERDGSSSGSSLPRWVASCVVADTPDFLVVNKPAGIATQGGSGIAVASTLDHWLPALAAAAAGGKGDSSEPTPSLRLVHRLDMRVSGLLLLAKSRGAAEALTRAFASHRIRKTYLALVAGALPSGTPAEGLISAPVVEAGAGALSMIRAAAAGGASSAGGGGGTSATATTRYVALPLSLRTPEGETVTVTLLRLQPASGRKHQLRQHVLHLFKGRHGIAGEDKYPGSADRGSLGGTSIAGGDNKNATPGRAEEESSSSASKASAVVRRLAGSELLLHSWHVIVPTSTLPGQTRALEARSPTLPRGLAAVTAAAGWAPRPGKSIELAPLPPPSSSSSSSVSGQ